MNDYSWDILDPMAAVSAYAKGKEPRIEEVQADLADAKKTIVRLEEVVLNMSGLVSDSMADISKRNRENERLENGVDELSKRLVSANKRAKDQEQRANEAEKESARRFTEWGKAVAERNAREATIKSQSETIQTLTKAAGLGHVEIRATAFEAGERLKDKDPK